jgi:L-lactate dehydrogenase
MVTHQRIAIIGAGHVGATAAYALMLRGLFSEIVLIDQNAPLAEAEAADLADANALARPARIWAGSYADAAQAQIAVITAGAATHGSETRLSVSDLSAVIVAECVDGLMNAGFAGIMIVAANPVDLMSLLAFKRSGLPAASVIGTGTLLDSSRLRQRLAAKFDVAAGSVDGVVIGEHGDSSVTALSTVRLGGLKTDHFSASGGGHAHDHLAKDIREAAYKIVTGKGYTSYGIATAIVRICEAILRDERVVLPVSTLLSGEYGLSDIYLSVPCIIGAEGIERRLVLNLPPIEKAGLIRSAETLRAGFLAMKQPKTRPALRRGVASSVAAVEADGMLVGPSLGRFETH